MPLGVHGRRSFFTFLLSFDAVSIEWDGYCSKAWYELMKQEKKEIVFTVDGKDAAIPVLITSNDEQEDNPIRCILVKIGGIDMVGRADTIEKAIFNLVEQLPSNVKIKCCFSCRHGNLCPVGNKDNEIFCVKDFEPKEKSDLFFVTEDYDEREKRSRTLFDICDDYKPLKKGYYTYNSFPEEF